MCRSIKPLSNFDPPATNEEIHAASLQFVRKISGIHKPSKVNEETFLAAVEEIASASGRLLDALHTGGKPKNREEEAAKAKARSAARFSRSEPAEARAPISHPPSSPPPIVSVEQLRFGHALPRKSCVSCGRQAATRETTSV
jgi:hypothetical protein